MLRSARRNMSAPSMSAKVPVAIGPGAGDTAFGRCHNEVWGTRTYDESAMFEAVTLGVFEVGLSWSIVFGKWDAFPGRHSGASTSPRPRR